MYTFKKLAPLPPFPKHVYHNAQVDYLNDLRHSSDVVIDDFNNIFYAFYKYFMVGGDGIYIYFYNNDSSTWETNHFNFKLGDIYSLRMYVWKDLLYVGVWSSPKNFHVIMISKSSISKTT